MIVHLNDLIVHSNDLVKNNNFQLHTSLLTCITNPPSWNQINIWLEDKTMEFVSNLIEYIKL